MKLMCEYNQNKYIKEFLELLDFIERYRNRGGILNFLDQWLEEIRSSRPGVNWAVQEISNGICYALSVWWLMESVRQDSPFTLWDGTADDQLVKFEIITDAFLDYRASALVENINNINSLQASLDIIAAKEGTALGLNGRLQLAEVEEDELEEGAHLVYLTNGADGHVMAILRRVLFDPNRGVFNLESRTYTDLIEEIRGTLQNENAEIKIYKIVLV